MNIKNLIIDLIKKFELYNFFMKIRLYYLCFFFIKYTFGKLIIQNQMLVLTFLIFWNFFNLLMDGEYNIIKI